MEFKQEHLLFFAFAALAIIVLWDIKARQPTGENAVNADQDIQAPMPDYTDTGINLPTPGNIAEAASYLTASQPYYFAFPPYQTLPETTDGQIGQAPSIYIN